MKIQGESRQYMLHSQGMLEDEYEDLQCTCCCWGSVPLCVLIFRQDKRALLFPLFAPFGLSTVTGRRSMLGACLLSSLLFSVPMQHHAQLWKDKCT